MKRHATGHRDVNHAEIAAALEGLGANVWDTSKVGKGYPDITAGWCGRTILVEVMRPDAYPYELHEHQVRRGGYKGGDWLIVTGRDDLLRQLGVSVQ